MNRSLFIVIILNFFSLSHAHDISTPVQALETLSYDLITLRQLSSDEAPANESPVSTTEDVEDEKQQTWSIKSKSVKKIVGNLKVGSFIINGKQNLDNIVLHVRTNKISEEPFGESPEEKTDGPDALPAATINNEKILTIHSTTPQSSQDTRFEWEIVCSPKTKISLTATERASISLYNMKGQATITTKKGLIEYKTNESYTGPINLRTDNGDISLLVRAGFGKIRAKAIKGNIFLTIPQDKHFIISKTGEEITPAGNAQLVLWAPQGNIELKEVGKEAFSAAIKALQSPLT